MELHKGKMSFKDLALWCGKSPRYFSNASADLKEKFFEIFSFYADYHFEDKKLIIDKVKYPTYTKTFDIIERALFIIAGLLCVIPESKTDLFGLLFMSLLIVYQIVLKKIKALRANKIN